MDTLLCLMLLGYTHQALLKIKHSFLRILMLLSLYLTRGRIIVEIVTTSIKWILGRFSGVYSRRARWWFFLIFFMLCPNGSVVCLLWSKPELSKLSSVRFDVECITKTDSRGLIDIYVIFTFYSRKKEKHYEKSGNNTLK